MVSSPRTPTPPSQRDHQMPRPRKWRRPRHQSSNLAPTRLSSRQRVCAGGGLWAHNSSFYVDHTAFVNNSAPTMPPYLPVIGASASTMRSRFEGNHGAEDAVTAYAPIEWTCSWVTGFPTGSVPAAINFEAVPTRAPPALGQHHPRHPRHVCGPALQHSCHERTIVPPAQRHYMPASGAVSGQLHSVPGAHTPFERSTSCMACSPGFYSAEVRATACACPSTATATPPRHRADGVHPLPAGHLGGRRPHQRLAVPSIPAGLVRQGRGFACGLGIY